MSADLQTFDFTGKQIRVVSVDGLPFFVAADVCAVLGLAGAASQHLRRLDADEKGVIQIHTPGGSQRVLAVNEGGLYQLILRSDKPEAKAFSKWVTKIVLPEIRRTGRYEPKADDLFETLGVEISLFNHDVQRDQSKAFAAATSHKDRIIDGRIKMCLAVTGRTPKRVREQGQALGLSKRDRESAPQVLRAIGDIGAPVYAAINLMVSSGTPLHDATKLKPELETNFSSLRETLLKGGVSERHFAKIPRERVAQLLADHESQRQALDHQLLLDLGG